MLIVWGSFNCISIISGYNGDVELDWWGEAALDERQMHSLYASFPQQTMKILQTYESLSMLSIFFLKVSYMGVSGKSFSFSFNSQGRPGLFSWDTISPNKRISKIFCKCLCNLLHIHLRVCIFFVAWHTHPILRATLVH